MSQFSSVQSLSPVQLFVTAWITGRQASLSITNSWSSFRFMSIKSVMPSSHVILCHPLLLLPPIPASIRVFSNESTLRMRWPKYWRFSFSIIPSKEIPGLISYRMDWLNLLAVQGTLNGLLQHHSSKVSILQRSAFFTVQLSHPYMTTGKTIALTRRTHHFMANRWGNSGWHYFGGLQNHWRWWLQPWNQKMHTPWKKSYDQPRQHIKKQRHHFANKGLSSQSYGFPVVMYGCESWTITKAES